MLHWAVLTFTQRLLGVVLGSIFMVGALAEFQLAHSLQDLVSAAAMCLAGAGVILNPAFYRSGQIKLSEFPRVCSCLICSGILLGEISAILLRS